MSFLSFLGGAAQAHNAGVAREAEKKLEMEKLGLQQKFALETQEMKLEKEYDYKEKEAERKRKSDEAERQRRMLGAITELQQLEGMNTEDQPYLSMSGEFPVVKFVKLGAQKLTEEEATAIAQRQNAGPLKDSGYISIALPRDDGRGWMTTTKEAKDVNTNRLFKTNAESQAFADETLAYYKSLNIDMVPVFEQQKEGTSVKFVQPTKESEKKPEKDPYGNVYNTNWIFANSPKVGGPDAAKKNPQAWAAVSLTGERVIRSGKEQASQVEDRDFVVMQTQGLGESAADRVENLSVAIRRDLTPEVVNKIIANKNTPAGSIAYNTMLGTFNTFVNTFKKANTSALQDRVVTAPIEERHAWLQNYMNKDQGIKNILSQDMSPRAPGGTPLANLMPINEPVQVTEGGITKMARPNLANSSFVQEVADPNNPGVTVKKYNDQFLSATEGLVRTSGVGQAAIYDILDSAVLPETGESSPRAAELALSGIQTIRSKLEASGEFVTNEGGSMTFQVPPMATTAKIAIMSEVNRFKNHNDRIIAMQAALPETSARVANSQLKDNSAKGRYNAVTGGGMKFDVVSEQLSNAQEMEGSINGLQEALVKDVATGEQGEVGLVLNLERLGSGVQYMFETFKRELTTDKVEGFDREQLFGNLEKEINTALTETSTERKNNALVKLYGTMLSYQLARLMDPNGRLSDEDRRTVEDGIGISGISANPDAILALTEELRGRVEYIKARNEAYISNSTKNILAAHLYDKLSGGGNFKSVFYETFSVDKSKIGQARVGTPASTGNNSGVTIDPAFNAFQRLLDAEKRKTPQTTPQPTNSTNVPDEIPVY